MDKFEYKVRAEEIKNLIAQGDYVQAAEIADTIDWRRVKSVMMLCTVSDLYKINRRYEDARDMLLLAYERRPGGRNICYSLCELSIKTGEFVQAMEYYKEFVQVAPRDPGRYILQYKLYEDQDVSLEERIEVLEELKKHDYREKWAYELAYLYHRVGLGTRCVEECDEMILWFGEGDYVIKAMELKMLHQPLSPEQQEKYDHRFDQPEETVEEGEVSEEGEADADLGQTREFGAVSGGEFVSGDTQIYQPIRDEDLEQVNYAEDYYPQEETAQTEVFWEEEVPESEEMEIHVKTMDMGQYNTMNLQAELAQGLRELLAEEQQKEQESVSQGIEDPITRSIMEPMLGEDTESLDEPEIDEVDADDLESEPEEMEDTEVFFGETGEIELEQVLQQDRTVGEIKQVTSQIEQMEIETALLEQEQFEQENLEAEAEQLVIEQLTPMRPTGHTARMTVIEPPKELAHVLSQEPDGQISLVVPEKEPVEKQITGQMNIEDILAEWERWKKQNEEKHKEEVRQRVLQQTGNMFTEFDAAVRDGLLEQLEKSVDEPEEVAEDVITEADEVEELAEIAEEEAVVEAIDATEPATEEADMEEEASEEVAQAEDEDVREFVMIGEVSKHEETDEAVVSLEVADEETAIEAVEEVSEDVAAGGEVRPMSPDEQELYSDFIQHQSTAEQIVRAVDNITLAAYTGNVIITGEAGMDVMSLAKNMIREVQATDNNFSGKVAKISGQGLNRKNVADTLKQLQNGALIIQNACDLDDKTVKDLHKALQNENLGIVVLLVDDLKIMNRFLVDKQYLLEVFTSRVDVKALSNDMLVAYGKQYAKDLEYAIDELGLLALHTCIEERQTLEHAVTTTEVQEIVNGAIRHASRKTPGHFFSILLSKRYDEEDMIIITEKDFV